jgi:hypothetical protein
LSQIFENNQLPVPMAFSQNFTLLTNSNKTKNSTLVFMFVFILLQTLLQVSFASSSISFTPSNRKINYNNTTYDFEIVDTLFSTVTDPNAIIELSFPSAYFTFTVNQAFSCFNASAPSILYNCKASTTNVVQIKNPLINGPLLSISINPITNPSSTVQITFSYTFKYANGTVISQATTSIYKSYSTGSLQSCTATFSPSLVDTLGVVTISMTLGDDVPQNGSIYVTFPSMWIDSADSSFTPVISTSTQQCTKVSSGNYLASTLQCTVINQQVLLTNSLNTTAPKGTVLSFSISNILSPPTTSSANTITIATLISSIAYIDQSLCLVTPVSAKSISNINSITSLSVGTNSSYSFSFISPTAIAAQD